MEESLHYRLMAVNSMFQKIFFSNIKDTGLTLGQPKVLDYLKDHDGAVQKEIASACHIEPASLTSVLNGMEKKQLIIRKMKKDNRRSFSVYLTENGLEYANRIKGEFEKIEKGVLDGFTQDEEAALQDYLIRIYKNTQRIK